MKLFLLGLGTTTMLAVFAGTPGYGGTVEDVTRNVNAPHVCPDTSGTAKPLGSICAEV